MASPVPVKVTKVFSSVTILALVASFGLGNSAAAAEKKDGHCNVKFQFTVQPKKSSKAEVTGEGILTCSGFPNRRDQDIPVQISVMGFGMGSDTTSGLGTMGDLAISGGGASVAPVPVPDAMYGVYPVTARAADLGSVQASNGIATVDMQVKSDQGFVPSQLTISPVPTPAPVPTAAPVVAAVPVKVIYVSENQPVQIVDSSGKLLEVVYLKRK